MSTIYTDVLTNASLSESKGRVSGCQRTYVVKVPISGQNSQQVLRTAMTHETIPQPGTAIDVAEPQVTVKVRDAKIVSTDGTNATVEVVVGYERDNLAGYGDETWNGETQQTLPFNGGASLSQINTQRDRNGNRISVSHTPDDGPTVTQTADCPVLVPQGHFTIQWIYPTDQPWYTQQLFIGKVNDSLWMGGLTGEWLCTNVQWELQRWWLGNPVFSFMFTFERKVGGWNPITMAYRLPDGTIPDNDGALATFDWYETADFSGIIDHE